MVKAGLDTDSPGNQAGYDADPKYNVTGFSQLHDDGTGGSASLSNFKLFPLADCFGGLVRCRCSINERKVARKLRKDGLADDEGSPGYFATNLTNNVRVELTTTRRAALHRYTFPVATESPRILLDLSNDGQGSNTDPKATIDPKTGRVTGGGRFQGSFGPGSYSAFVCVDFFGEGYTLKGADEYGIWTQTEVKVNATEAKGTYYGETGAILGFSPHPNRGIKTSILARVGVSLISSAQACSNAESEIPNPDFELVRGTARGQWNELLSRVQVDTEGVDQNTTILLYSSLYRSHIVPADYTGENPLWNSTVPYYDSFYCNWDTYRTLYPLYSIHDPIVFADIVRGMIDIQQHEGWLPECRSSTIKQWIQGGSDADPILAEFFVKFHWLSASLGVQPDHLFNALMTDAESEPPNWDLQGRQAWTWKKFGYLPIDSWGGGGAATRHVSRALEYAFDDFSISQVAKILGRLDDAEKLASRAQNFIYNWDPSVPMPGHDDISGFMQLRKLDGTFTYTDPRHCSRNDPTHSTCYLDYNNLDGFYESSPVVYIPHDTAKLIELQGGNEKFIKRLDIIFDEDYFDSTDEPSQQIPFMYHYADRPGLSTMRSRRIITSDFNTTRGGLPGNDGAMGSYAFFYLAGLYPLPATTQFLLSSPYFPRISFYNPLFKTTTTIKVKNFKGNPPDGIGTVYVKSVTIDGVPWKSNCYIEFDAFVKGATIELELTDDITVGCGVLPPSLSTGEYDRMPNGELLTPPIWYT
ncbi:glycoside hydrolase family 92 protein [Sphaerobolus stellatus SS14]|nr:glycoside hydrolase family 92 protein [Sphaerobolus stellatus SS14]